MIKGVTEQEVMENILNYYHSGYDISLFFLIYAFANRWSINKMNYYVNLLKES